MNKLAFILPLIFILALTSVEAVDTLMVWDDYSEVITMQYGDEHYFHASISTVAPPADIKIYQVNGDGVVDHVYFEKTSYTTANFETFLFDPVSGGEQSYTIIVQAKDAYGDQKSSRITAHIIGDEPNQPPVLDFIPNQEVIEGNTLTFTVTGSDPENDALLFNVIGVPEGAIFNSETGVFTWTPNFEQGNNDPTVYTLKFLLNDVVPGNDQDIQEMKLFVYNYELPNSAPVADFSFSPEEPEVHETVTFDGSHSYDSDGDTLTYAWDLDNDGQFDDGTSAVVESTFAEPGTYSVSLRVSDGQLHDTISKNIIVTGQLVIDDFTCFENIIEGHPQSCSIIVSANGQPVGDAQVIVSFDEDGEERFGVCDTNLVSGGCSVEQVIDDEGEYTVYAHVTKTGYQEAEPQEATFTVLSHRYDIKYFDVYRDSAFTQQETTFYRGENLYVKFKVWDRVTRQYVTSDVVTEATLVSNDGGGRIDLAPFDNNPDGRFYKFKLTPIPLTHDFIGDSNVFVFSFNFADESGGQAEKRILILNNLPTMDTIPTITLQEGTGVAKSLTSYGYDLEDASEDLTWVIIQEPDTVASVQMNDQTLEVDALEPGMDYIGLELRDLDYVLNPNDNYPQQLVKIIVKEQPNNAPVLDTITDKQVIEGDELSFTITATDADNDSLTFFVRDLPEGADFDELTGEFAWTPDFDQGDDDPTDYTVKFGVTDGQASDYQYVTIDVYDFVTPNRPPVMDNIMDRKIIEGNQLTFTVDAFDPDGDELTFGVLDLPEGASFDEDTGVFTWTPNFDQGDNDPSLYNLTFTVTDGALSDADTMVIFVYDYEEENQVPIANIVTPTEGFVFDFGATIVFVGTGEDPEDGTLTGSDLVWFANGQEIGTGTQLAGNLAPGQYTITLEATDSEGAMGSDSVHILVKSQEIPDLSADVGGPYTWYATKPFTVDASESTGDIVSYTYDFGDGTIVQSSSHTISHTYAKPGTYTITLVVRDAHNQTAVDSTTATMKALPRRTVEPDEPELGMYVGKIFMLGDGATEDNVFKINEYANIEVELENNGEEDLEDLRVTVIIPELGIRAKTGGFDLDEGDEAHKTVRFFVDYGYPGEEYYAKIIINNDEFSRVKYRYFTLQE